MEETKGQISRIFQNQTKSGKPYWVLSVLSDGGEQIRYSVWNWKMLEGVNEGEVVSFKYQQKNGYNNIMEIVKTEKPGAAEEMLSYQAGGRVEQIARMSAIKSATQLLSTYDGKAEDKMAKTLETAREFEKYIFQGIVEAKKDADAAKPDNKKKVRSRKESPAASSPGPAPTSSVAKSDLPI